MADDERISLLPRGAPGKAVPASSLPTKAVRDSGVGVYGSANSDSIVSQASGASFAPVKPRKKRGWASRCCPCRLMRGTTCFRMTLLLLSSVTVLSGYFRQVAMPAQRRQRHGRSLSPLCISKARAGRYITTLAPLTLPFLPLLGQL